MVTLPFFLPVLVGWNVTLTWQVAFGASVMPALHVVALVNAKFPLMLTAEIISGVVPVFFNVLLSAALVVPVFCLPKLSSLWLNDPCGLITVAVMAAVCGLPVALSVIVRVADCLVV